LLITILETVKRDNKVFIFYKFEGNKIKFDSHVELTDVEYKASGSRESELMIVDHLLKTELHFILNKNYRVEDLYY